MVSLLSTYGLYLISSLIFFDPAHMFTSFLQYLLVRRCLLSPRSDADDLQRLQLAPSYTNVRLSCQKPPSLC